MFDSHDVQLLNRLSYFLREAHEVEKEYYRAEMLPLIPVRHYRRQNQGDTSQAVAGSTAEI